MEAFGDDDSNQLRKTVSVTFGALEDLRKLLKRICFKRQKRATDESIHRRTPFCHKK